jgi:hypothetical protein
MTTASREPGAYPPIYPSASTPDPEDDRIEVRRFKIMDRHRIVIERAAEIALNFLFPAEREQVMHDLEDLGDLPFPPEASNVHRVKGSPEMLVLRTLDQLLIVFARGCDGTIVVQDLVNQGIIDRYFRDAAPVG